MLVRIVVSGFLVLGGAVRAAEAQDSACINAVRAARATQSNDSLVWAPALKCADEMDLGRRTRIINSVQTEMLRLATESWTIPESHDEQRLSDGGTGLGPVAFIFASPHLGAFRTLEQIRGQPGPGLLVALVVVDTTLGAVLPPTYQQLGLRAGKNCVWLSHVGPPGPNSWRASVTPPVTTAGECRDPMATPTGGAYPPGNLRVYREAWVSSQFQNADDYPAVARFTEDAFGRPLLGVRCLKGWCDIGPQNFQPVLMQNYPGPNTKERKIKGWSDTQRLALLTSTNLVAGPPAILTPEPNLDQIPEAKFASGWIRVAEVNFPAGPGSKYASWGFSSGANQVAIQKFPNGSWRFQITNANGQRREWKNVHRHLHRDAPVPGTVRWRFTAADDGIWVPCGSACCRSDGNGS
jgi:hypothetical protein